MGHEKHSVGVVIVAAGSATRFGSDKMLINIDGKSVIRRCVETFCGCGFFEEIVVVAGDNIDAITAELDDLPVRVIKGGKTRFKSVCYGVKEVSTEIVAVHDGARPFVTKQVIEQTLSAMSRARISAPALPVVDTIKVTQGEFVSHTPDRDKLVMIQTPQTFYREDYLKAARDYDGTVPTDDCSVMERAGYKVLLTKGDTANIKITTVEDVRSMKRGNDMIRVGQGYDVHRLVTGRRLILGGVSIEYEMGLLGHSDADVLCHAISDALLGAAALGDIGKHFPDTDERYKDADSIKLLSEVSGLLKERGYRVSNIDSVVIAQRPKIAAFIPQMVENISAVLGIKSDCVSVKATTQEGLGFSGRGEGIASTATVLIVKEPRE